MTDTNVLYAELFDLDERGLREQEVSESAAADQIPPIRGWWEQRTPPSQLKKARVQAALDDDALLTDAVGSIQ